MEVATRRVTTRGWVWVSRRMALLIAVVLLVGCAGSDAAQRPEPPVSHAARATSDYRHYVALGDSYTAAPGVPVTDIAFGCFRSDHNYPSLVADTLGVDRFTDVSCSGATTENLTRRQLPHVPPQLRAVTPTTDLITLGFGGNDYQLFSSMIFACAFSQASEQPCAADGRTDPADLLPKIRANLRSTIATVRDRAPRARVLVIGYPQLLPDSGTCPARIPIKAADYGFARRLNRQLNAVIRKAATAESVDYIDVYAASVGHDICAPDPWVNGRHRKPGRAEVFHPFQSEQQAIAGLVLRRVDQ